MLANGNKNGCWLVYEKVCCFRSDFLVDEKDNKAINSRELQEIKKV